MWQESLHEAQLPDAKQEIVTVVATTQQEAKQLAAELNTVTPEIASILHEIDTQPEQKEESKLSLISQWIESISKAIKSKDRATAFSSFTRLLWGLFSTSAIKPSYWKAERDMRGGRLATFSEHDIWVLLNKLQHGNLTIEKKLAYARLISRRWDAECDAKSTKEPAYSTNMLNYHVSKGRIQVGDIMTFGGPEKKWVLKEIVLQAVVKSKHTHAAVITNTNPLEITHATKEWVHTSLLMDYITHHKTLSYTVISGGGTVASEFAKSKIGTPYDANNGLAKKRGDDRKMHCSELAMKSYAMANKLDLAHIENEGKVFPEDLFTLSYPKYVADWPRDTQATASAKIA